MAIPRTFIFICFAFVSSICLAQPITDDQSINAAAGQSAKRLPVVICKFDGSTEIGEFFPESCIGISSVEKLDLGHFKVNFARLMANTDYVILVSAESTETNDTNLNVMIEPGSITIDSFEIKTGNFNGVQNDMPSVHVVVYGEISL